MKLIPLSQKSTTIAGKYFAKVDDEDYDYLMQWNWSAHKDKSNDIWYAVRQGRIKNIIDGEVFYKIVFYKMHRVIMNTPENLVVDHIFGNGLDNRKSKLRNCTRSQNCKNKRSGVNSSSKYLGVYKVAGIYNYWQANIVKYGVPTYLGTFKIESDAAKAYNEAATKYHGEFAKLNIIE